MIQIAKGTHVTDPEKWLAWARGRWDLLSQLVKAGRAKPHQIANARTEMRILRSDIKRVQEGMNNG